MGTPQHQALKMRHWLTGILFISLQLSDGSVKLFKDNQELQEYEARKMSDYDMVAERRQLELKLSQLNSLLKRPSDLLKIQLDSEESAEVFQLRQHYQIRKRSPKRSKKGKKRSKES